MDNRKTLLLEIKHKAGLATPEEIEALASTPIITGEGLATPRPAGDADAWHRRWYGRIGPNGYATGPDDPDAEDAAPYQSTVTQVDDGIILCKPENEPAPAGKPGFRPGNGTVSR